MNRFRENNEPAHDIHYAREQIERMQKGNTPVIITGASYLGDVFAILFDELHGLKKEIKELKENAKKD